MSNIIVKHAEDIKVWEPGGRKLDCIPDSQLHASKPDEKLMIRMETDETDDELMIPEGILYFIS